ncbi:hypothetical protein BLS_002707 [Venturia inaequalis]|uniref:Paf1-domain-containing protein n=1 Tax=Venturia inaequalis TaxID=5025 RepID=A0A8H3VF97_VENIN|nr:hypothetical protein BLS_002707 [Venturia inaequalis]KAE9986691.1 hypothetical protein EG328_005018 [Venturia inaequalis]KAE9989361.1 hypothetical protein EG327_002838 [Venturia inaequalis]RDI89001.1 hypothetical protein Vi05172_g1649 [Venturia inaequalis]
MSQKQYHQDYIARIRYSNALPPPPFNPKFLDIPNTGLTSGDYTTTAFASRLAREYPVNIEADAELGMPIDLIGIKGVFDGDETAIHFPDNPAPLHPKDQNLLRPLNQLGKPLTITSGVSFLRKTEYITSSTAMNRGSSNSALRGQGAAPRKRRAPEGAKDDPFYIHRAVIKGFDIAYPADVYTGSDSDRGLKGAPAAREEKDAWAKPRHPTNPQLTLLDAYPLLPDLEALPDNGSYMVMKYQSNPCSNLAYDPRLDVAIIRPIESTPEETRKYEDRLAEAAMDPAASTPMPEWRYHSFVPEKEDSVEKVKRKFNSEDPEHDSENLYDSVNADGDRTFKYKRLRTYETQRQTPTTDPWNDTVAVALHDDGTGLKPKAAYLYPIISETKLRASRPITMGTIMSVSRAHVEDEADLVDFVELKIRDATEEERENIVENHLKKLDPTIEV